MSDRGIKKWAPYKALVEQTDSLRGLDESMDVDEKPLLSCDQEEEINDLLVNYHGQTLNFKYYRNKKIYTTQSKIIKIDVANRWLVLEENKKILLSELVGLSEY